jgi:hypothetical protein
MPRIVLRQDDAIPVQAVDAGRIPSGYAALGFPPRISDMYRNTRIPTVGVDADKSR